MSHPPTRQLSLFGVDVFVHDPDTIDVVPFDVYLIWANGTTVAHYAQIGSVLPSNSQAILVGSENGLFSIKSAFRFFYRKSMISKQQEIFISVERLIVGAPHNDRYLFLRGPLDLFNLILAMIKIAMKQCVDHPANACD